MGTIDDTARLIQDRSEVDGETLGYAHSHNIANALAEAGLLAPDLPAKDEWDGVTLILREGKTTVVKDVFTDTIYSIPGARMHALDLLAAANYAEEGVGQ